MSCRSNFWHRKHATSAALSPALLQLECALMLQEESSPAGAYIGRLLLCCSITGTAGGLRCGSQREGAITCCRLCPGCRRSLLQPTSSMGTSASMRCSSGTHASLMRLSVCACPAGQDFLLLPYQYCKGGNP